MSNPYSCIIHATISNGALSGGDFERKSSRVLIKLREIKKATHAFASLERWDSKNRWIGGNQKFTDL